MYNEQELQQDTDGLFWLGETSDSIVIVPVNIVSKEINKLFMHYQRKGMINDRTWINCVNRVKLVEYWIGTIYHTPRMVALEKRPIRIDVLTRNFVDKAFIEHDKYVGQIIALDTDYAILRRTGTDYHEVVFHDRLTSSEVQRIERFLLSMHSFNGIECNLFVNFTLSYDTVIERFNDRYILVEQ